MKVIKIYWYLPILYSFLTFNFSLCGYDLAQELFKSPSQKKLWYTFHAQQEPEKIQSTVQKFFNENRWAVLQHNPNGVVIHYLFFNAVSYTNLYQKELEKHYLEATEHKNHKLGQLRQYQLHIDNQKKLITTLDNFIKQGFFFLAIRRPEENILYYFPIIDNLEADLYS